MIKSDMLIFTIDGPFYAPNHKRVVRVIRKSDTPGSWLCRDYKTGEELVMQEGKLIQSLNEMGLNKPDLQPVKEQL